MYNLFNNSLIMKELFNFLIILALCIGIYGLTCVRELHPDDGWGWLYWPLIAFTAWWGDKIKEDYQ